MAMRIVRVLVCALIVAMDVAAGILAIEAQVAQTKAIKAQAEGRGSRSGCKELPSSCSSRAFKLALAAAVLLALAHVTSNLLGGCTCVCSSMEELERSSSNRKFWFACLVSSWIIAAIGLPMVITGMLENSRSRSDGGGGCCRISSHQQHFLSTGGVLCFVHALLSLSFYCSSIISVDKLTTTDHAHDDNL
ncbi:hypothetical protein CRG98_013978 [Punica granatum]|uniref:Uncharacterized protein n=1 Tax=Punica granatum TaxID=22663 RepID=A0A2I0KC32_PUNGR|nr:hypothetical protein CRG98_013978 [Punica granatum]